MWLISCKDLDKDFKRINPRHTNNSIKEAFPIWKGFFAFLSTLLSFYILKSYLFIGFGFFPCFRETPGIKLSFHPEMDGGKERISVAIVEDIEILREELAYNLRSQDDLELVCEADSMESYLEFINSNDSISPEILLLDIGLPGMSGLEGLTILREKQPKTDVIMITAYEQKEVILKALCSGAVGYISKKATDEDICTGIRIVHSGGSYMSPQIAREIVDHLTAGNVVEQAAILSERQKEIIDCLVKGATYSEIAKELHISVETVRSHIKKMYRSLEVHNKAEAIAMYLRGEVR
jgi:DNA-binding NarL/FixJ family response regulator